MGDFSKELQATLAELDSFGVDGIVHFLVDQNIRGFRGNEKCCPIANLIKQKFNVDEVEVLQTEIYCRVNDNVENYEIPGFELEKFIVNFDLGYYPKLEQ